MSRYTAMYRREHWADLWVSFHAGSDSEAHRRALNEERPSGGWRLVNLWCGERVIVG